MTDGFFDFETYSAAGFHWDSGRQKWTSLPWWTNDKKGLDVVGADNYIAHESFEPLCLAYCLDGQNILLWSRINGTNCPAELRDFVESGGTLSAWNVGFDSAVWGWCADKWGWPKLPLEQQRCSMARSRAAAYPGGLDNAASVLGTERKDKIGINLIRKLTVPRNPTKDNPRLRWTPETAPKDFNLFFEYCRQDVRAEMAASAKLPPMTKRMLRVWEFDQKVNRRGMCIDLVSVEHCIVILGQAQSLRWAELERLTMQAWPVVDKDGVHQHDAAGAAIYTYKPAVREHTEVAATLKWISWKGYHFHELDEETVGEALKRSDLPADVARVLRIRQELSFGSVKKLYQLKAKTGPDGRLRDQYSFHGAHTGLWNGVGAQPANFPRPMHPAFERPEEVERALKCIACRSVELLEFEYGQNSAFFKDPKRGNGAAMDPLEVIASCLRSLIIAGPGMRLISADFNAIQAVVTSALAGEEWRLEVFRTHGKIYEAMAARLTPTSLDEQIEYKKKTGHHHPVRQNPGKLAVLSGDFGAWVNGWKRFGADKLLGSDENIKAAIMKTRKAQPAIVELWGGQTRNKFNRDAAGNRAGEYAELFGLEGAAISAIRGKHPAGGDGLAYEYRGIVYQMHGNTLFCHCPSGGVIRYHNAAIHPSERPYASPWEVEITYEGWNSNAQKGAQGWQTMSLYAGVLTQNVVAHESWEIQCAALLELEDATYPVVMHTHDEGVLEVPIGSYHTAAEATTIWRRSLPVWAKMPDGRPWPIKVPDAWEHPRYGKW